VLAGSPRRFFNPRGLRIFTQRWTPGAPTPVLSAVAVVHGFTGESSWMVQLTAVHLAASGFAVVALDDCDAAFASFRADHPPPLPCFLYGESLGGAIALLLHLRRKDMWRDGAVLNDAMCGVSPRFKPPWPLEHLTAAAVIPMWRVTYTRGNILERSFKVEWKRALALA
jgi:alpha-beta hydrolase superfamily lysophospholipase